MVEYLQIALLGMMNRNAGSWIRRRLMCGGLGAQNSEAELK
jgi:hypothetical protein